MTTALLTEMNKFYGVVKHKYNACTTMEDWIKISIRNAVNDLMPRTLTVKGNGTSLVALADEIAAYGLSDKIKSWLNSTNCSESDFDDWHHDACAVVLIVLNKYYDASDGGPVHYGKAQKIVNMTFKYLYCSKWCSKEVQIIIGGDSAYEDKFIHCHMPLDSYILEWYYGVKKVGRASKKIVSAPSVSFSIGKTCGWSNLDYDASGEVTVKDRKLYSYNFYVQEIRAYFLIDADFKEKYNCEKTICFYLSNTYAAYTPLQAEFFVWTLIKAQRDAKAANSNKKKQ